MELIASSEAADKIVDGLVIQKLRQHPAFAGATLSDLELLFRDVRLEIERLLDPIFDKLDEPDTLDDDDNDDGDDR